VTDSVFTDQSLVIGSLYASPLRLARRTGSLPHQPTVEWAIAWADGHL